MVSERDVTRMAKEIIREGGRPTREEIRSRLGGGSPNEISEFLKVFLDDRRRLVPATVKRVVQAYENLSGIDKEIFRDQTDVQPITNKERKRRVEMRKKRGL